MRHVDHPRHAEAVDHHAESRGKEGLGQAASAPGRRRPSAANSRSASASSGTVSDSEKPWKPGSPWHRPSDAITVVSPMRKLICITLSSQPGGTMIGIRAAGSVLEAHDETGSRRRARAVEFDRFLAAAIEKQVSLNVHCFTFFDGWEGRRSVDRGRSPARSYLGASRRRWPPR